MLKNYFFLAHFANYLSKNIVGLAISDIFTQEKDTLYVKLEGDDTYPFKHLVLCTNNQSPYILVKNEHHKAKKNVTEFFPELTGAELLSATIALGERDIKIKTSRGDLHFVIRGNKSNIYFRDNTKLHVFKSGKTDSIDQLNDEFGGQIYVDLPEILFDDEILADLNKRRSEYPFVSKEIIREAELLSESGDISGEIVETVINKIYLSPVAVYYDDFLEKVILVPSDFRLNKIPENAFESENINDAFREYIFLSFKTEKKSDYKKDLQKYFDRELGKLSSKINNLESRVSKGSRHEEYYAIGNLLLANLHLLKKGDKLVELTDFNDAVTKIELNEKLNPNENANAYFEKAKNEKINFEKSKELYNNTVLKYNELLERKKEFDASDDVHSLKNLNEALIPSSKKSKMIDSDLKVKYRHYLLDAKYHVFVGKDSKSNDLLSTRVAKQNDYWFHARGLPGSHVVLRVDNTKEVVPKSVIKNAASIAAYWSKAKTAKVAPVSYTFGKFVYKKKGFEPGQVALSKESVLLVKPEIPANAEVVEE